MILNTTAAEEDYLKAIFKQGAGTGNVSTNALAATLGTSPASVTDMLKKMSEKGLVEYTRYKGVGLTDDGRRTALYMLRKHRLWEVFLCEKLRFPWHEVHAVAEQLEHVRSTELINKLDEFLGFPRFDPHGDPIPDVDGNIQERAATRLSEVPAGAEVSIVAVTLQESDFLRYLDRLRLGIGTSVKVLEFIPFDASRLLRIGERELIVNHTVAQNLIVEDRT